MPGAGTDKTRHWVRDPGPIVILVEPQLGENIGAAARAMANFGLSRLRLVKPRGPWPNPQAHKMASGADRILEAAVLFDSLEAAIADCTLVLATTARGHDQAKPVIDAPDAARLAAPRIAAGENVAILFGRERTGLENQEVALADRILTLPVNPAFASLNLAQAVVIVGYEWFKHLTAGALPFAMPEKSSPASKQQLLAFFASLEQELEKVEFFRPPDKRATMQINLRNIFTRMQLTQQDIRTLHGVITAIAQGRKWPARGGVLDGAEAEMLRTLLAEQLGRVRRARRCAAWPAVATQSDRGRTRVWTRSQGSPIFRRGFKRQTPIGCHIADLVSSPLRVVVDLVSEGDAAAKERADRRAWLAARGYHVVSVAAADVTRDPAAVLDYIDARIVALDVGS
jgi:tRNA/rRNA methyltransferase